MTFYAGQRGLFFWFVFFGPAKKMNKGLSTEIRHAKNKSSHENQFSPMKKIKVVFQYKIIQNLKFI
ncbi:MAG: hypothetical protein CFE24_04385 [Flavobacterium sp. BFFFF2]|nr:MAG: hypothetical protein CFE24_04385 [Flavobacterium sp. BFFFF2]